MDKKLKPYEQELLNKMNRKAMLIVQIEETLQEIKLPIDKNSLYKIDEKELVELLEMLNSTNENRKKYVKDETNN